MRLAGKFLFTFPVALQLVHVAIVGVSLFLLGESCSWLPAIVKERNANGTQILVHFDGYPDRYDEWIPMVIRVRELLACDTMYHNNTHVHSSPH